VRDHVRGSRIRGNFFATRGAEIKVRPGTRGKEEEETDPSIRIKRLRSREVGSEAAGASKQSRAMVHRIYYSGN
jgi:hypothetical protein